jgi:hypothetical protein
MRIAVGFLLALLAGCALPEKESTSRIVDADEAGVADCTFVRQVDGTSMYGGPGGTNRGLSIARERARRLAEEAGATHVVWSTETHAVNAFNATIASGRAYRCD